MILRASHLRFDGGLSMRPVYLVVDEAHEYFDQSISDMLEQARKANIGLIIAHQSLSQAKGRDGGGNIADPLMVNTATKIVWTAYKEDAAKFAGSMRIKPKDILDLPQFTFGMYSRKQGFRPIRGVPNALADFDKRRDKNELKNYMEAIYGAHTAAPEAEGARSEDRARDTNEHSAGRKPETDRPPPDVDMI